MKPPSLTEKQIRRSIVKTFERFGCTVVRFSQLAIAIGTLLAGTADGGSAQADPMAPTLYHGDSVYIYLSAGSAQPLHPRDFLSDWNSTLALRLAAVYRLDATRSVFLGVEHSTFSTATVPENPEMRVLTIIPGLALSHRTNFAIPYARLGAGLVRQGLRRMTIDQGSFRYLESAVEFAWTTGFAINGAAGALVNPSGVVFPYVEASYVGSRAAGVTVGHVTFRVGLAIAPGRFFDSVRGDPVTPR